MIRINLLAADKPEAGKKKTSSAAAPGAVQAYLFLGLFAGGAATWVYAFHCTESGMPFITIWYTTGILAAAALGAIVGRWALRWR